MVASIAFSLKRTERPFCTRQGWRLFLYRASGEQPTLSAASLTVRSRSATGRGGGA